ncbi:MAG: acyltransferase [Methylorubrum extorquens]|jgi:peptidoglycan/LPS O-acetylase OafA/YrhL|uniref:acyltransferase family protein n=1 Tax=Methylorubrum extorquens TaxID=408 RepID=UPI0006821D9B|nr:acyltransferase [Methylorubrum extorquens]
MSGALRLLLAIMVILSHFGGDPYYKHFGYYAVRVFFILSGFAITAALNEVYAFELKRFWANRALRLLPLYYLVLMATLATVLALPDETARFSTRWAGPNLTDFWLNLMLLPMMSWAHGFRLVMPAWSIAVEIMMYAYLVLGFARRKSYATMLFAAAVAFHTITVFDDSGWDARYFDPHSATLGFSIGALIYFWRRETRLKVSPRAILPLLMLWIANTAGGGWLLSDDYARLEGFYLNSVIGAALVAALAEWRPTAALRNVDGYLGELAYPAFLCHSLAGFTVALTFFEPDARGIDFTLVAIPASLVVAVFMATLNQRWIEPLRRKIRRGAKVTAPPSPEGQALGVAGA